MGNCMPITKGPGMNDPPEGLEGYWWENETIVCIPFIENDHEGDGTFSKWLTELETKKKIVFFPTVLSRRLDSILKSKGYTSLVLKLGRECVEGLAKDCRPTQ